MFASSEIVKKIREKYPAGTKIRLIHMDDIQAPSDGTFGVVTGVDDTGSLLMQWDTGSRLNLICDADGRFVDSFEVVV